MAGLSTAEQDSIKHMAEDPCTEEELLSGNKLDAVKGVKGEDKPETKLPPLSAADFRVYNSMADHMDQFVSLATILTLHWD